jgi:hypothetical protein
MGKGGNSLGGTSHLFISKRRLHDKRLAGNWLEPGRTTAYFIYTFVQSSRRGLSLQNMGQTRGTVPHRRLHFSGDGCCGLGQTVVVLRSLSGLIGSSAPEELTGRRLGKGQSRRGQARCQQAGRPSSAMRFDGGAVRSRASGILTGKMPAPRVQKTPSVFPDALSHRELPGRGARRT